jgi:hypothetical protein
VALVNLIVQGTFTVLAGGGAGILICRDTLLFL